MSVRAIEDDRHFQQELQAAGGRLVVVDFTATWCGPCQRIAPEFEKLPKKYPRAVFLKVDVDKCQDTASSQGVRAMPTFYLFKNKSKIDSLQGADIAGLEAKIQQHVGSDLFSGSGQALGGPVSTPIVPVPQNAGQNEENEKLASQKLNVDASQPTTSIQIRLSDGSRLSGRFNLSHTVNDIRTFIVNSRPQYAAQTFTLLTTFPSKELTDSEQTIEKAGLTNAAIMQRLK